MTIKHRTGKECKQTKCDRHSDYLAWNLGAMSNNYCMQCKYAHLSQFVRAKK